MTKAEFFKNLKEIVTDNIYLTENIDELNKEIENNHWSIGIDSYTAKNVKNEDLKVFLRKVVKNRIAQLDNSDKNMDLIFYSWFDEQAGNLNLNFINAVHEKLPFKAELEFVDSIDAIINDFLNSGYLDGIPCNELENSLGDFDDNDETDFKLKVYKEKIIKSTKAQSEV
jgi:dynactin complex subunit